MNIQLINYNQCLIVGHPNSVLARQAKTKFGTNDPIKCTQIYENVMQLFWQLCCKNTKCAEIMQSRYLNYNIILWMCILKSWFHEPRCLKSTKKLPKLTFLPQSNTIIIILHWMFLKPYIRMGQKLSKTSRGTINC